MSRLKLADFDQSGFGAASALASLAGIDLQEYGHRVEIVRDRIIARCSDALAVADEWRNKPGEPQAVAAYVCLSSAMDLSDSLWWLFETRTRESDQTLEISRRLTHMRGILTDLSPMVQAMASAVEEMSPPELH